jgi:hypothetical protein
LAAGAQIVVDLDDATTELATLSPYDIVFSIRDTTLRAQYNAELFDVDSIDELLKQARMPHARTPNAIASRCSRPHVRAHRHAHAYRAGQGRRFRQHSRTAQRQRTSLGGGGR